MARPHLIFLMADQLRHDVLGAYGDEQCPTPHLDQLAEHAAIFDRHFTPCPLCVPARSSIMTGLHTHRHGAIINGWFAEERAYGTIKPGTPLLPRPLLDAGYRVVHAGIQHLRTSPEIHTLLPGMEFLGPQAPSEHYQQLLKRGLYLGETAGFHEPVVDYRSGKPVIHRATGTGTSVFPLRDDLFFDCALTANMVKLIQEHDGKKPLALFGMYWLPHPPLRAPQNWVELINPAQIKLPATVGHWCSGQPAMQLNNIPGHLGAHVTMDQWRHVWAVYLGMVALLDQCLGQVIAALRHAGLYDEALIVVTSDHGEMLGCHGMFQKMCLYEEVVRVPLLIKLPGQAHAQRVRDLTDHTDLTATMLDLGEAEPLPHIAGHSLRGMAHGSTHNIKRRQHVFAAYDGNAGRGFAHRMVRSDTHKLIHNIQDHPELYDLIEDPRETRNLSGMEPVSDIEEELRSLLNEWMDEMGDPLPPCR